ncbi:recombinase family protein (plasmid) [Flammeovirga pectinis]|uniref:Recombinase family protein n=1 Tax=Flammeovirga pectinis TaxID=2494373 RepID=A0A3Q9FRU9_9BACT|nr:recombinase family protein [Flammeovirga pectinis]AZQ65632.1 recombinase family protein [Flammeovirga pectinis]
MADSKNTSLKIGYARVSKADGSQVVQLQRDALISEGVNEEHIYEDFASGKNDKREGLNACLKALRPRDTLVVWKLDRLGRNLKHLISTVEDLDEKNIGFKVLTGKGANIDTTTPSGKFIFGIFGALAEFERDLIRERTVAGLKASRARGLIGGRKFQLTKAQVRLAEAAMKDPKTIVTELCKELNISRQSLYRYVGPKGELREAALKVLNS